MTASGDVLTVHRDSGSSLVNWLNYATSINCSYGYQFHYPTAFGATWNLRLCVSLRSTDLASMNTQNLGSYANIRSPNPGHASMRHQRRGQFHSLSMLLSTIKMPGMMFPVEVSNVFCTGYFSTLLPKPWRLRGLI